MRKLFGVVVSFVLVASAAAVVAGGAAAQVAGSMTVTPSTDLVNGQIVAVEATGIVETVGVLDQLAPSIYQCVDDIDVPPPVVPGNEALEFLLELDLKCRFLQSPAVVDGEVQTTVAVHGVFESNIPIFNAPSVTYDCGAVACMLLLIGAETPDLFEPLTIKNYETAPLSFLPIVQSGSAETLEGDTGSITIDVPVSFSAALPTDLTLNYSLVGVTATADEDFVASSGSVEFPAGTTAASVPVEVLGDDDIEPDETGEVLFELPAGQPTVSIAAPGTFTIIDDDDDFSVTPNQDLLDGATVALEAAGVVDNGGLETPVGDLMRPGVYQCDVAVKALDVPSLADGFEIFDWLTAFFGECVTLAATVPVPGGQLSESLPVRQTFVTGNEPNLQSPPRAVDCASTDCVIVVAAVSGAFAGVNTGATIDYFASAPISFAPSILPGGVLVEPEGDAGSSTVWQLPVRLSEPLDQVVTIDFHTVDTPANPFVALSGSDYVATSGTVTFAPGETEKFVPIEVMGDDADEPALLWGEWGIVMFENPSANVVLNTRPFFGAGLFMIIDDD